MNNILKVWDKNPEKNNTFKQGIIIPEFFKTF